MAAAFDMSVQSAPLSGPEPGAGVAGESLGQRCLGVAALPMASQLEGHRVVAALVAGPALCGPALGRSGVRAAKGCRVGKVGAVAHVGLEAGEHGKLQVAAVADQLGTPLLGPDEMGEAVPGGEVCAELAATAAALVAGLVGLPRGRPPLLPGVLG